MLAAGLAAPAPRCPGSLRPAIAVPIPTRDGAVAPDRRRRQRRRPPRAPAPVRRHGLGLLRRDPRSRRARPCACSRSARSPRRATRSRIEAHALLAATPGIALRRQRRGRRPAAAARPTSSSRDGFTGNVALKLLEGTIKELLDLLREEISATARGKLGGLLIRPAARRLRARLDPDTYGGAYLLGLRGLAVDRARELGPAGDRERDRARRARRRAPGRRAAGRAAARAPSAARRRRSSCRSALSARGGCV